MKKIFLFICLSMSILVSNAQSKFIDEDFDDWSSSDLLINDGNGDAASGKIDIESLSLYDDQEYLYIHFILDHEIILQSDHEIMIQLDLDLNINTGNFPGQTGSELIYRFGEREGTIIVNGVNYDLFQQDIGLVSLPTVSASSFEIRINKTIDFFFGFYNMPDVFGIALWDESVAGDKAPDTGTSIYQMKNQLFEPFPISTIAKSEQSLRIASYNTSSDEMFEASSQSAYQRILRTIDADIYCFQEIYDHSALETERFVSEALNDDTTFWYRARFNPDIIILSKYPITGQMNSNGNGLFRIEVNDKTLLLANVHLPCCENDNQREDEIDQLLANVRDAKQGLNSVSLETGDPIIVLGDFNLVTHGAQQRSLITGDIQSNEIYGPDLIPDWDGGDFADIKPFNFESNITTTWYNPFSSYPSGRLDYLLATTSVLNVEKTFVLNTSMLAIETLGELGLQSGDSERASDHFPLVMDISLDSLSSHHEIVDPNDFNVYPNPAEYYLFVNNIDKEFSISLINMEGTEVLCQKKPVENENISLNVSNIPSGIYILRIETKSETHIEKVFIVD